MSMLHGTRECARLAEIFTQRSIVMTKLKPRDSALVISAHAHMIDLLIITFQAEGRGRWTGN